MLFLSDEILKEIYPYSSPSKRMRFLPFLNDYMNDFLICTPARMAAFLAQIGHESAQLRYTEEIAFGNDYEGRRDLGNIFEGDGVRFKDRGLIQITGRSTYMQLSEAFGIDLIAHPKLLQEPNLATRSACWWWYERGLNVYADSVSEASFKQITQIINGGYNGYADRHSLWEQAKKTLGV